MPILVYEPGVQYMATTPDGVKYVVVTAKEMDDRVGRSAWSLPRDDNALADLQRRGPRRITDPAWLDNMWARLTEREQRMLATLCATFPGTEHGWYEVAFLKIDPDSSAATAAAVGQEASVDSRGY